MLGKTHKAGGFLAFIAGFHYMYSHNMLISEISPAVQFLLMCPVASYASIVPDLDQSDAAVPDKTPVSLFVHRILRIGHCSHRNWLTHSWVITGGIPLLIYFLLNYCQLSGNLLHMTSISYSLLKLIIISFIIGLYSHLFLDSLTMKGVWLVPRVHFRLVPPVAMFGTGTTYEKVVEKLMYFGIVLYVCYFIINFVIP